MRSRPSLQITEVVLIVAILSATLLATALVVSRYSVRVVSSGAHVDVVP